MLVFFFKQKTAYEMRISDWSSDVCSSDLLPPIKSVGMPDRRHGREEQHVSVKRALVIGSSGGIGAALVNQLVASGRFDRIYARNRRPHEIGRASRRERGCPYVKISVVAVTLKKKCTQHLDTP